jgi:hypothetical protein
VAVFVYAIAWISVNFADGLALKDRSAKAKLLPLDESPPDDFNV